MPDPQKNVFVMTQRGSNNNHFVPYSKGFHKNTPNKINKPNNIAN